MKRALTVILILLTLILHGQDKFNDALVQLNEDLKYCSETKGEKYYHTNATVDEWLIKRFDKCSDFKPRLKEIDFKKVKGVKTTYVKSKTPIERNLHLRVQIQEWSFDSEDEAIKFESELDESVSMIIECINKGGMTWWVIGNKIYTIFSRAYRFTFEYEVIKASLNKKLR